MKRPRALSLLRNEKGAIAPFVAITAAIFIASTAFALDIGVYYVGNRNLRSATEAAALSAAIDPTTAAARVNSFLVNNGYPSTVVQSVEVGRYCPDSTIDTTTNTGARFVSAGSPCPNSTYTTTNAVRVKTSLASQQFFSRIFGSASPIPLMTASATAARIDEAGLAMTTGVLGVSNGLVNSLLSLLAGTNVALSSTQYQALLASNIDAAKFFDALATRVGETGTYSTLVSRTVSIGDIIAAAQTALNGSGSSDAIGALGTLSSQLTSSVTVPLNGLFGLGVWAKMPVGGALDQPNLRAGLNLYQLITYALQQGHVGGLNLVVPAADISSSLKAVGVTQVTLIGTALGQVSRARFSFGPAGETIVGTSALRIQLKVTLANLNGILNGISPLVATLLNSVLTVLANPADIPLVIDVGAGTASLSSISCSQEASSDTNVSVAANSGLLSAYIGNFPYNPLASPLPTIAASDVQPTNLVNVLGLLTVNLKAVAGPVTGVSKTVTFRQVAGADGVIGHPPLAGQGAYVGNQAQLGLLMTSVTNNLVIGVCVLGSCVNTGPVTAILSNVTSLVSSLLGVLGVDPLVDGIFNILGIQPGYADVWVTGARCGVPVLV